MNGNEREDPIDWTDDTTLPAEDEELYQALSRSVVSIVGQGIVLSPAAASALESVCAPEPLTPKLRSRLNRIAELAEAELGFDEHLATTKRSATLAAYAAYLRKRSGLSAVEAAMRFRVDPQWITALERNLLRPHQIPARRLTAILRGLQGTLERTEELLATTIQAPRWIPVSGRDSLFRGGPGTRGLRSSPADPEVVNPDYAGELQAAERLREALRKAWRE